MTSETRRHRRGGRISLRITRRGAPRADDGVGPPIPAARSSASVAPAMELACASEPRDLRVVASEDVTPWRDVRTIVPLRHETRFCTAPDGVGLAYAIEGQGPPLGKASNWMTHLEYERQSPVWRHWVRDLSRGHTLVRYDERGCGLSDRQFDGAPTLDTYVGDLAAVVDAAGVERFSLLGLSGGGPTAIRSEEHTSELQSHSDLVCRLLLEKKKKKIYNKQYEKKKKKNKKKKINIKKK